MMSELSPLSVGNVLLVMAMMNSEPSLSPLRFLSSTLRTRSILRGEL